MRRLFPSLHIHLFRDPTWNRFCSNNLEESIFTISRCRNIQMYRMNLACFTSDRAHVLVIIRWVVINLIRFPTFQRKTFADNKIGEHEIAQPACHNSLVRLNRNLKTKLRSRWFIARAVQTRSMSIKWEEIRSNQSTSSQIYSLQSCCYSRSGYCGHISTGMQILFL